MERVALNEMYFGKPIQLTRIEDHITAIRMKYRRISRTSCRELNRDPILKKIGEQLVSLFGFKEAIVTVSTDEYINAFTIPHVIDAHGNLYPLDDKIIRYNEVGSVLKITNAGFRFITKKFPVNLVVVFTMGCFNLPVLTTQELVAIILHEIGHQFFYVVTQSVDARADERFADAFASQYGYGNELASALKKITIVDSSFDKKLKDVPILNFFYGLNQISKHSVSDGIHPHLLSRYEAIIDQMEQDIKDTPMSAEAKKDLEKQVENLKAYIKDNFDPKEGDNIGTRMMKGHFRNQPNGYWEKRGNEEAKKSYNPVKLNEKIRQYQHKKGWFK